MQGWRGGGEAAVSPGLCHSPSFSPCLHLLTGLRPHGSLCLSVSMFICVCLLSSDTLATVSPSRHPPPLSLAPSLHQPSFLGPSDSFCLLICLFLPVPLFFSLAVLPPPFPRPQPWLSLCVFLHPFPSLSDHLCPSASVSPGLLWLSLSPPSLCLPPALIQTLSFPFLPSAPHPSFLLSLTLTPNPFFPPFPPFPSSFPPSPPPTFLPSLPASSSLPPPLPSLPSFHALSYSGLSSLPSSPPLPLPVPSPSPPLSVGAGS